MRKALSNNGQSYLLPISWHLWSSTKQENPCCGCSSLPLQDPCYPGITWAEHGTQCPSSSSRTQCSIAPIDAYLRAIGLVDPLALPFTTMTTNS
jgi:hypothetical protein